LCILVVLVRVTFVMLTGASFRHRFDTLSFTTFPEPAHGYPEKNKISPRNKRSNQC
jgi:hypothetical protein